MGTDILRTFMERDAQSKSDFLLAQEKYKIAKALAPGELHEAKKKLRYEAALERRKVLMLQEQGKKNKQAGAAAAAQQQSVPEPQGLDGAQSLRSGGAGLSLNTGDLGGFAGAAIANKVNGGKGVQQEPGTLQSSVTERVNAPQQPFGSGGGTASGVVGGLGNLLFQAFGGPDALGFDRTTTTTKPDLELRDQLVAGLSTQLRDIKKDPGNNEKKLAYNRSAQQAVAAMGGPEGNGKGVIQAAQAAAVVGEAAEKDANNTNANEMARLLTKSNIKGKDALDATNSIARGDHERARAALARGTDTNTEREEQQHDSTLGLTKARTELLRAQIAKLSREQKEGLKRISVADLLGGPSFGGLTADQVSDKLTLMQDEKGFLKDEMMDQFPMLQGEFDRIGQVLVAVGKGKKPVGWAETIASMGGKTHGNGVISIPRQRVVNALTILKTGGTPEQMATAATIVMNMGDMFTGVEIIDGPVVNGRRTREVVVGNNLATTNKKNPNSEWAQIYSRYVDALINASNAEP